MAGWLVAREYRGAFLWQGKVEDYMNDGVWSTVAAVPQYSNDTLGLPQILVRRVR